MMIKILSLQAQQKSSGKERQGLGFLNQKSRNKKP